MKKHHVEARTSKIIVGPNDGARLPTLDIAHKVTAKHSGGSLVIDERGLPPGQMIPPHTHDREDGCTFVLEGELTCYVGGEIVVAPAGFYVVKPRNVPHAFYNAGTQTMRVMELLTLGGGSFEGYFGEYEEIVSGETDDEERRRTRAELGERCGITWHDEQIPEVRARLGIEARDEDLVGQ